MNPILTETRFYETSFLFVGSVSNCTIGLLGLARFQMWLETVSV